MDIEPRFDTNAYLKDDNRKEQGSYRHDKR